MTPKPDCDLGNLPLSQMLGGKGKMFLCVEHLWMAFYLLWFFKSIAKPKGISLYVLYRRKRDPL